MWAVALALCAACAGAFLASFVVRKVRRIKAEYAETGQDSSRILE
jgi:uncharacterized membrane protein YdjX (TVP38/TMEM64 family)